MINFPSGRGFVIKLIVVIFVAVVAVAALAAWVKPSASSSSEKGSVKVIMMPSGLASDGSQTPVTGQINVEGASSQQSVNFTIDDFSTPSTVTVDNLTGGTYKLTVSVSNAVVKTLTCGLGGPEKVQVSGGPLATCAAYLTGANVAKADISPRTCVGQGVCPDGITASNTPTACSYNADPKFPECGCINPNGGALENCTLPAANTCDASQCPASAGAGGQCASEGYGGTVGCYCMRNGVVLTQRGLKARGIITYTPISCEPKKYSICENRMCVAKTGILPQGATDCTNNPAICDTYCNGSRCIPKSDFSFGLPVGTPTCVSAKDCVQKTPPPVVTPPKPVTPPVVAPPKITYCTSKYQPGNIKTCTGAENCTSNQKCSLKDCTCQPANNSGSPSTSTAGK